jgi:hypothetical protein
LHADNSKGYAYIGDPNLVNSSDAASVVCEFHSQNQILEHILTRTVSSGTDNSWTGAPNTTGLVNGTTPDWSNVTLFVPESGGRVGFLNGENSTAGNAVITSFVFYGSTAMAIGDDGDLDSLWYGLPVGDTGVHQLYWNDTTQGQVPVVVRSIGPSNPNDRRR